MNTFNLHILASNHTLYEGECESLVFPTTDGMMGIQAGHIDMIAAIVTGEITYLLPGGEEQTAAVSDGMIKVENNDVVILVDSAERPEDIDILKAQQEAEDAKEQLLQKRSSQEYYQAEATLSRAMNQLRVGRKHARMDDQSL